MFDIVATRTIGFPLSSHRAEDDEWGDEDDDELERVWVAAGMDDGSRRFDSEYCSDFDAMGGGLPSEPMTMSHSSTYELRKFFCKILL